MDNIIQVLNKVSNNAESVETLYVNSLLLDNLFGDLFGGVTRILESIEKSTDKDLMIEGSAGIKSSIMSLFLDIKAGISAEGRIGEHEKTLIEKELTINKKIKLCEAALLGAGQIVDVQSSESIDNQKLIRITDKLSTFYESEGQELKEMFDEKSARAIIRKWRYDRSLTPNEVQLVLATNNPFPMYGIIQVQSGLNGSTFIGTPPFPGSHRSVLAQIGYEEDGVRLLKIYWVIDKSISPGYVG